MYVDTYMCGGDVLTKGERDLLLGIEDIRTESSSFYLYVISVYKLKCNNKKVVDEETNYIF